MPGPTTASEPVPPPPPSRRRTGLLPASPADQEGLFRGLLWVARAVKECAAALPRLADRLGEVERRVVALAERPAPAAALGDRRDPEAAARLDAVEQRLQRLDALAQARAAGPPVETGLRDLRRDLATADRRLAAMELRLAPLESLPASVEELVARHVDRLATETLSLPADVEGVYRELDAVAEVMAARQAAASQSVRRIEALEAALAELRGRVAHLVEEHDDDAADRDHAGTAASVEPGPQPPAAAAPEVESPEGARRVLQVLTSELERIRQSIDVLVLDRGAASPGGGTFGA
jgi:chromosome segregation ATPase